LLSASAIHLLNDTTPSKKYKTKTVDTPMHSTIIIPRDKEGKPHSANWSYCSIIGKLNFLEKLTRPEIAYAVHMCARALSDPKESHTKAVNHIGRYLLGTHDIGIIL
jgi:histone deacetylase 1/2